MQKIFTLIVILASFFFSFSRSAAAWEQNCPIASCEGAEKISFPGLSNAHCLGLKMYYADHASEFCHDYQSNRIAEVIDDIISQLCEVGQSETPTGKQPIIVITSSKEECDRITQSENVSPKNHVKKGGATLAFQSNKEGPHQ